jgi:hypothetical protein
MKSFAAQYVPKIYVDVWIIGLGHRVNFCSLSWYGTSGCGRIFSRADSIVWQNCVCMASRRLGCFLTVVRNVSGRLIAANICAYGVRLLRRLFQAWLAPGWSSYSVGLRRGDSPSFDAHHYSASVEFSPRRSAFLRPTAPKSKRARRPIPERPRPRANPADSLNPCGGCA